MLSLAVAIAFLMENKFIQINWLWQLLLWGLIFALTLEEYRYSRFLFLFDASVFAILSIICPALLPLGAAALLSASFTEVDFKGEYRPKWIFVFLLFLILWDILLVAVVYPHTLNLMRKFSVPVFVEDACETGWLPILGSGDFVVMGFLMILFDLRWYLSAVAYAAAVLFIVYSPLNTNLIPAIPFIVLSFCIVYIISRGNKTQITLLSGRGLAGLYWLAKRRQNNGGDKNGEPKAL